MEVSHFELIYKPQAPIGVGGTGPVDTVLQGYFLEITNLERKDLKFEVEFVALPPQPGQSLRSLAGNTLVFIDTPGQDNSATVLSGGFGSSSFVPATGPIAVPPRGTALVAVVPSVFGVTPFDPTPIPANQPEFEVRGFVRVNLPALRKNVFFREAQADAPVRVMLTPQNRTSYYRPNGNLSDQTQASLPTVSGSAIFRILPEPSRFDFPIFTDLVVSELPRIPLEARPGTLVSLLAEVDPSEESLRALNAALSETGIGLTVAAKSTARATRRIGAPETV